jgi:uncharacterized protein YfeS
MSEHKKQSDLIPAIEIPKIKELISALKDPSYIPIDGKDLNSVRLEKLSAVYKKWYGEVLKDQSESIHETFAKVKASKVIYGHGYEEDVDNTIQALDDSVKKLIMKSE